MRFIPKISNSLLLALGFATSVSAQLEWSARNSGQTRTLHAVTWTGKLFAAVGDNGVVSTSSDGIQWTPRTSGTTPTLYGVAGRDSLLVAVGANGTILRSVDGGTTWESRSPEISRTFYGVLRTDAQFVAVGSRGTLFTSPDGFEWMEHTPSTTTDINAAAWNGSRIVAVGDNGLIHTSPDGIVWTDYSVNTFNEDVDAVVWTGSMFAALGENSVLLTSPDGQIWTSGTGPGTVMGVTWNGSRLVAVGLSGEAWTSPDGNIWTPTSPGTAQTLRAVTKGGGDRLVAVGGGGTLFTAQTVSAPPGVPVPGSPQTGATGVSLLAHFAWEKSPTALSYHVQIAGDSTFSTPLIDTVLTETSLNVLMASFGTVYYWRVAGVNEVGAGEYSNPRRFETQSAPTTPPPAPLLIAPAQFAKGVPLDAQFRWNEAATATHYRIQVSRFPDFSSFVLDDSNLSARSRSITLAGNTEYYWRVRGRNLVGSGPWSETSVFQTVATVPEAPVPVYPSPFAEDIPVYPTFRWTGSRGADSYRLQVSTTSDFSTLVTSLVVTDTQVTAGPLEGTTPYYWRVRAYNNAVSGGSPYSATRRFTTGVPPLPAVPVLESPVPFAKGVSPTTTTLLAWKAVAYATSYRLQLSTTPDFSTLLRGDSGITGQGRMVGPLAASTEYYWRVRAANAAGISDWSEIWSFSTGPTQALSLELNAISLRHEAFGAASKLRFVLEKPEQVVIRLVDVRGREAMPAYERALGAGIHEITLAPDLAGTWYVLDFRAGDRREILKLRP